MGSGQCPLVRSTIYWDSHGSGYWASPNFHLLEHSVQLSLLCKLRMNIDNPQKVFIKPSFCEQEVLGPSALGCDANQMSSMALVWERLYNRLLELPPEIIQMIMDALFEDAFSLRKVYPHKDPSVANIFLALDQNLYHKYHKQYWSQNTWVIGKGSVHDTMRFMTEKPYNVLTTEFSRQMPNRAALKIQSAEMYFTKEDMRESIQKQMSLVTTERGTILDKDLYPVLGSSTLGCQAIKTELKQIWQDKFDRIAMLDLRHFTLNLTEAYGPDGEYLGIDAVLRLIPFVHGLPTDFQILAPSKALADEIRAIFEAMNT